MGGAGPAPTGHGNGGSADNFFFIFKLPTLPTRLQSKNYLLICEHV